MIKITGTEEELNKMKKLLFGSLVCFWSSENCGSITCEKCIERNFNWEIRGVK